MFVLISSDDYYKIPQTEWFKQQEFIAHSSGHWKCKIKVPAGLVSSEESFLGLQISSYGLSSVCVGREGGRRQRESINSSVSF